MGKLRKEKVSQHTVEHSNAESQTHSDDKEEFAVLAGLRRLSSCLKGSEEEFKSVSATISKLAGYGDLKPALPSQYFLRGPAALLEITGEEQTAALEAERARLRYHVSSTGHRCEAIPVERRIKLQILPMLPPHSLFIRTLPLEEQRDHYRLQAELIVAQAEKHLGWRILSVGNHQDTWVAHFDLWCSHYSAPEHWKGRKIKEASKLLGDTKGFQNIGLTAASFFRYEADGHAQFTRPGHEEFARAAMKAFQSRYPERVPFDLHIWLKMDELVRDTYGKRPEFIECVERWYDAKARYHRQEESKAGLKWAKRDAEKDPSTALLVKGIETYLSGGATAVKGWFEAMDEEARNAALEKLNTLESDTLRLSAQLQQQCDWVNTLQVELSSLQSKLQDKEQQLIEAHQRECSLTSTLGAVDTLVIQLQSENCSLRNKLEEAHAERENTAAETEEQAEAIRQRNAKEIQEHARIRRQLEQATNQFDELCARHRQLQRESDEKERRLNFGRAEWRRLNDANGNLAKDCQASRAETIEARASMKEMCRQLATTRQDHDKMAAEHGKLLSTNESLQCRFSIVSKERDEARELVAQLQQSGQQFRVDALTRENDELRKVLTDVQGVEMKQAFELSKLRDDLKDHAKYYLGYLNTQKAHKQLEVVEEKNKALEELLAHERRNHCDELNRATALAKWFERELQTIRATQVTPVTEGPTVIKEVAYEEAERKVQKHSEAAKTPIQAKEGQIECLATGLLQVLSSGRGR